MLSFSLITRPGRAVAIVAAVGLLFGAQGTLALRWRSRITDGYLRLRRRRLLVAALLSVSAGLSVLAPLHSRLGTIGAWIVRAGLAGQLLGASISLAAGRDLAPGLFGPARSSPHPESRRSWSPGAGRRTYPLACSRRH